MGTWEERDWHQHYMMSWYAYPGVERRLYSVLAPGQNIDNNRDFLCWMVRQLSMSGERRLGLLELGCGPDPVSSHVLKECGQDVESVVCIDLSEKLVDRARAAAQSECAEFRVLDMETMTVDDFRGERFDLCIGVHSVHHVLHLEHLFECIKQLLLPNGLLWMNEYTGPRFMDFPPESLAIGNRFLSALPDDVKTKPDGSSKNTIFPFVPDDPTEAIASDEIVRTLMRHFEPLRLLGYGTLSYMVFDAIAHNFRGEEAESLGEQIWEYEQRCFLEGTLTPWFTACIARPRGRCRCSATSGTESS